MEYRLDHEATEEHSTPLRNNLHHDRTLREKLADKRNLILLVATLIATLTFQSAMNPPGGVWQEDSQANFSNCSGSPHKGDVWPGDSPANFSGCPHEAGEAVMAYNHPRPYATFYIADLIGFIASLSTIFLVMTALRSRNHFISRVLIGALIGVMCLTIISVVAIVAVSISAITPEIVQKVILRQTAYVLGVIAYCVMLLSPVTALVAFFYLIPHGTVDVNHANGDEEAPQIQVDINHANEDLEPPQIQADAYHVTEDQEAPLIQLYVNHTNGDQGAPQIQLT